MINMFGGLTVLRYEQTRLLTIENMTEAKASGGQVVGKLGSGRQGKAYLDLKQGTEQVLADIQEWPGEIRHILITVTDKTKGDYFVLWDLVLRMYWDGEEFPMVEAPLGDFFCNDFGIKTRIFSYIYE